MAFPARHPARKITEQRVDPARTADEKQGSFRAHAVPRDRHPLAYTFGVAQRPLRPDSPDRRRDQRRGPLALAVVVYLVPCGQIALLMSLVTTFLFHFSGGQTRMGPVVDAGPLIALAFALVVGISTAWRTAQYGPVFKMMLKATLLIWLVIIVVDQLLSVTLLCQSVSCGLKPPG